MFACLYLTLRCDKKKIITIKPYRITVKRKIMMNIYYNDGVNPSECVHTCNTLEEAEAWVAEQLKGYTLVDAYYMSTEDVLTSAKTAQYQVYDGEPIAINEDGESNLTNPVYESNCFYTE